MSLFKVKITESGTTFNEELEIDSRENTVTFHIAPHNNVDLSDIMYMFELVCYFYSSLKYNKRHFVKIDEDGNEDISHT